MAGALADRARLSRSRPDVVPSVVEKCLGSARVRHLPVVRKTGQPADRRAFRLVRASRRPSCVYCTSRWKATKARALWYVPVRASFPHQLTRSLAGGPTTRAGPQTTQGRRRHGPGPRRARQVCFSSHRSHDLTDAPPTRSYGPRTVKPAPILQALPKIFAHADAAVRAQGTALALALHGYLGPALDPSLKELKPVQVKELGEVFKAADEKGEGFGGSGGKQTRWTRVQQRERMVKEAEGQLEGKVEGAFLALVVLGEPGANCSVQLVATRPARRTSNNPKRTRRSTRMSSRRHSRSPTRFPRTSTRTSRPASGRTAPTSRSHRCSACSTPLASRPAATTSLSERSRAA